MPRRQLEKKLCRLCHRRDETTEALCCAQCVYERIRIEKVRVLAMSKYPKLQNVSVARFVESLWVLHLKDNAKRKVKR